MIEINLTHVVTYFLVAGGCFCAFFSWWTWQDWKKTFNESSYLFPIISGVLSALFFFWSWVNII